MRQIHLLEQDSFWILWVSDTGEHQPWTTRTKMSKIMRGFLHDTEASFEIHRSPGSRGCHHDLLSHCICFVEQRLQHSRSQALALVVWMDVAYIEI